MNVQVEYFSRLREAAGVEEDSFELPEGIRVADLLSEVYRRHPALAAWDRQILVAAKLEWVERDHVLSDGDLVSLMPPVQGG